MGLDTSSFIDEYSSFVLLPSAVSLAETRGSPVRGFRKIPIGNEAISLFGLPGPLTTSKTRIDPRGRLTRTDPTFVETILTRWVERSWVRSDPGSQRSDRSWNRAQMISGYGIKYGSWMSYYMFKRGRTCEIPATSQRPEIMKMQIYIYVYLDSSNIAHLVPKQGKSEGFDSCKWPSNLTQIGLKSSIFSARVTFRFDGRPWKIIGHLCYLTPSFVLHLKPLGEFKLELLSGNSQFGSKSRWAIKFQTGVTVRKRPIWVKIGDFLSRVTFKFDGRPWKIIGHLCYLTPSFVLHLKPLGEFKLELLSGNSQFGSKSRWAIKFQTGVTVRKRPIWVKIGDFLSRVTLKFDGWPWKTIRHLFYVASSFVHHFIAIGEFKLKLQPGNTQFGSKSAIFCPVWPWNLTDDIEKQ